jgi:hypothetical protein
VDELLHGLRTDGEGGVQDLLQLQPRWRGAGAQRGFDLAFLHLFALGQRDGAVIAIGRAWGDRQVVHAFQALDDAGAAQVIVSAQIHRAGRAYAAGDEVDMLAFWIVVQHEDLRVIGGESHPRHIVVADDSPVLRRESVPSRQAQTVVPHGFDNVGT